MEQKNAVHLAKTAVYLTGLQVRQCETLEKMHIRKMYRQ